MMKETIDVYVLDTSAWLAFIENEAGADIVFNLLEKARLDKIVILVSLEKIKSALGFVPKKTVRDAIGDVKDAFENGLIPDYENIRYYNVKKMKELGIG